MLKEGSEIQQEFEPEPHQDALTNILPQKSVLNISKMVKLGGCRVESSFSSILAFSIWICRGPHKLIKMTSFVSFASFTQGHSSLGKHSLEE